MAADTMNRMTLDLGGNDAGTVLPDVDAKEIVESLFWVAFINNGQSLCLVRPRHVRGSVSSVSEEDKVVRHRAIPSEWAGVLLRRSFFSVRNESPGESRLKAVISELLFT